GYTESINAIASATGFQVVYGGCSYDAFLVQFNAPTGARNWGTYYGGTAVDYGYSTACDNTGNVYLAGTTMSSSTIATPPGPNTHQTVLGGYSDAFLVQFKSATGTRNWGTYYGGTNYEYGSNAICDNLGNVYLSGSTSSTNAIATTGVQQQTLGGIFDAFLVKFNSAGVRNWGTYYGGSSNDNGYDVACDNAGGVYLVGETISSNAIASPLGPNTHQPAIGGGNKDAFLVKFNTTTGARNWGTYYGGQQDDVGYGVACDNLGNVYLAGITKSSNAIASAAGYQNVYGGGGGDCFLVQFKTSGTRQWGTYFGSALQESFYMGKMIALDASNNVYLYTEVEDAPGPTLVDPCSYQPNFAGGCEDQIIVKFNSAGKKICTTYFGGAGYEDLDSGGAIAISGNVLYICASNYWQNPSTCIAGSYPVTQGAWQVAHGNPSSSDAVLASLCTNICGGKTLAPDYTAATQSICTNTPVKFTPSVTNSCDTTGYKYHWVFTGGSPAVSDSVSPTVKFSGTGTYNVKLAVSTFCGKDSVMKIIAVNPCTINATTSPASICHPNTCTNLTASGSNGTPPYTYSWSTGGSTSTINVCPTASTTYTVKVTDALGNYAYSTASVTNVAIPSLNPITLNITCITNGVASVSPVAGASSPYTYKWNTGETTTTISCPTFGTYSLTVTDKNGCTVTQAFTIAGPDRAVATFTYPSPICVGTNTTFTNTGTPPGPGIIYSWKIFNSSYATLFSSITTDLSYTFLTAGTYHIQHRVTTNSGCSFTLTENIVVVNCIGPIITANGSSVCPGACATVTSSATGGSGAYTYSWSTGATTQNINPCPTTTTTYTVKVTDGGGATSTSTAVVTVNPAVTVIATSTNITCSGKSNGGISAIPGGGTPTFNYVWSNGITTSTGSNLAAGNYTVTVIDSKGCTAVSTTTISTPPALLGQFTKGTANCSNCGCKEWIMVNATGGTSPYAYTWPDGYDKRYKNALCPGIYNVIVTDKNGCKTRVKVNAP
ncbi:MAG: hypothetical protein IT235_03870, partial [Bacteroidia bacterium]|nr:hypothetical protein [Bacteroidia bacterium]